MVYFIINLVQPEESGSLLENEIPDSTLIRFQQINLMNQSVEKDRKRSKSAENINYQRLKDNYDFHRHGSNHLTGDQHER